MNWLQQFIASLLEGRPHVEADRTRHDPQGNGSVRTDECAMSAASREGVSELEAARPKLGILASSDSALEGKGQNCELHRSGTPTRYLAIGKVGDRKGYTTAIRAFALSGKLGDRLTIMGYGRCRRGLERWAKALRVDAIIDFSHATPPPICDLSLFDAVIIVSFEQGQISSLIKRATDHNLMLISPNNSPDVCAITAGSCLVYMATPYDTLSYGLAISHISRA